MSSRPAILQFNALTTTVKGLFLAGVILSAWVTHLIYLFTVQPEIGMPLALHLALQCFLSTGLFIVAHDSMHGTLAPRLPIINDWVGRLCLFLYGGFSYGRLRKAHMEHHQHPATKHDPDHSQSEY